MVQVNLPSAAETSVVPFAGDAAVADGDADAEVGALEVGALASLLAELAELAEPGWLGWVGSAPPEQPARRPRTAVEARTAALTRMRAL